MSVKPTLPDELLKVNSALKPIFPVIEDQCSDTALQNKLMLNSYSSNGKQKAKRTSDFIKFYAVLSCLRPILDFFKMFIGSGDHYE